MSTSHDDLRRHPGHLIRRAQQVHYWLWNAEVSPEVTSPQFAVLYALRAEKNIDQKTLGERVSLDRSTTAEVVARLKSRGLIQRFRDPRDGRRNLLRLTAAGVRTTERLIPKAVRMNRLLVSVLSEREQSELLRMLNLVVDADERLRSERSLEPPWQIPSPAPGPSAHASGALVPGERLRRSGG
jgi:DNA-binding MarR family transcriptional regulator